MDSSDKDNKMLLLIPKCNINFFKLKQKAVISSGACQIFQTSRTIRIKSPQINLQVKKKSQFIRYKQLNYLTFLVLREQGGVFTISIPTADVTNQQLFQNIMNQHTELVDFFNIPANSETKKKIGFQTPINDLKGAQFGQNNDDKLESVSKGIGSVFGGISSIFRMDKYNKQVDQTITKVSKDTLGPSVLSGWQKFKNKCAQINDVMSDAIKPVSSKCKQIVEDIGNNFDQSQNAVIKNVRQYSKKTQKAMNSGYETADAPRRVSFSQNQNQPAQQKVEVLKQLQKKQHTLKQADSRSNQNGSSAPQKQQKSQRTVSFDIEKSDELQQKSSNERKSLL